MNGTRRSKERTAAAPTGHRVPHCAVPLQLSLDGFRHIRAKVTPAVGQGSPLPPQHEVPRGRVAAPLRLHFFFLTQHHPVLRREAGAVRDVVELAPLNGGRRPGVKLASIGAL